MRTMSINAVHALLVKRILAVYSYKPDIQMTAIQTALQQADVLPKELAA
ncbi:MAG: hypothetical protein WCJ64_05920 [Rhodospirillaceae bacterium]